jgi:hypothetical protein
MGSFGLPKEMKYPGGGDNAGDTEERATEPAMPGPRVTTPVVGETKGANLTEGFGSMEQIHDVTPEELGMDTQGGGQVHVQMPKGAAGRGTRWG